MEKRLIKKKIRYLLWIAAALFLLIMLVDFGANLYVNQIFREQVRDFEKKTSGFYRIESARIRISMLSNRITMKNFRLIPKANVKRHMEDTSLPDRYYRIELALLKIKGISISRYIFFKSLTIRRIILKNPKITVYKRHRNALKVISNHKSDNDVTIPINVRSILLHLLRVKGGSFSRVDEYGKAETTTGDFELSEFKLNCHIPRQGMPILIPGSLDFIANRIHINLPDNRYSISIEEMGISASLKKIWLRLSMVYPRYPKYSFSRNIGYRITRKSIKVKWLTIHGIDMAEFIENNTLRARLFSFRGIDIDFFSNRQMPRRMVSLPKKFPQQYLRELKLKLHVEKVKISKGRIVYEEGMGESRKAARIFFTRVKGDIENINNIKEILSGRNDLKIRASSKFMDKTDFKVNMGMSVQDQLDRFTFSGNLGAIDGSMLNPILRNNSIHIKSGHLNGMSFQARGNRFEARGKMALNYRKLNISLLMKRKPNKKDTLSSFFINWIIQSNNPRKNKPIRIGNMHIRRKEAKSIFNMMWKSFLAGVKSSIGLKRRKR